MTVLNAIGGKVAEAPGIFGATLWTLVLGFGLSGAVQTFVSNARMHTVISQPGEPIRHASGAEPHSGRSDSADGREGSRRTPGCPST